MARDKCKLMEQKLLPPSVSYVSLKSTSRLQAVPWYTGRIHRNRRSISTGVSIFQSGNRCHRSTLPIVAEFLRVYFLTFAFGSMDSD